MSPHQLQQRLAVDEAVAETDSRHIAVVSDCPRSSVCSPPSTVYYRVGGEGSSWSRKTNSPLPPEEPFSKGFFHRDDQMAKGRRIYVKSLLWGIALIILTIFCIFSIFWGALWKTPVRPLEGVVVDFDGGVVGLNVTLSVLEMSRSYVRWKYAPATDYPLGHVSLAEAVKNEESWVAIAINLGATERLNAALLNPNPGYNGSHAITVYAAEARSENAFRNFIRPETSLLLDAVAHEFATQLGKQISSASNLGSILSRSPQTIVRPIYYTIDNLIPFSQPVATAATLVGLIYLVILSFFVVMIGYGAREASGFNKNMRLKSLILVRFATSFSAYFIISLFYTLLNKAFQLDVSTTFGPGGFMVFWMLNWVAMLAVGLTLESLVTILTVRFIPFFLLSWIIVNVSPCINPIEVLPWIYRYGYAIPFYNISRAIRTISMGTRNRVGMNFGILLAWVAVSCITLPLFQWLVRWRVVKRYRKDRLASLGEGRPPLSRS